MILGNITRILSVFVFFGKGRYLIVEYFFFYQIVSLCIVLFGLLYSRKYGYKIRELIHCFKFDKEIFEKMKKLSVTALLLSLSMIVLSASLIFKDYLINLFIKNDNEVISFSGYYLKYLL